MRLTKYLPLCLLLVAVRAHAQEPVRAGPGLVIEPASLLAPPPAGPRLGLASLPPGLRPALPAWSLPAWSLPATPADPWSVSLLGYTGRVPEVFAAADTVPRPPRPAAGEEGEPPPNRGIRELELPEVVQQVADLAVRVEGRGGLGGAWNRFLPCDPSLGLQCQPDLMPQLRPEIEFGVEVGGTITDRLHINVDYDQRREFDTANNINVHYQGMPGELVQRLEMGDVSIALPASRYMTQGIPSGNFGFKATAQVGPTEVEAVWAQQRGQVAMREFRLGGGGQAGLVQEHELVLDDADYVTGQFFFVADPTRFDGWPHIDVLRLVRGDAPADVRPVQNRLVVYRDEGPVAARQVDQARAGKFLADAISPDGLRRHSGLFKVLEPGIDYYVHPSGLWIALRAPLRDDEALAVTYVTASGLTLGDPSPETASPGQTPELLLVRPSIAVHQPGQPTWPWELHQVYRLDGSAEVDISTLELVVSLGHAAGGATFKDHGGTRLPLLRLFGLDESAPTDRLDESRVFRPGADFDAIGPTALRGTFIVFPTLEPFHRPPAIPSEGLSADAAAAVLGVDANRAIYEEVDPVARRGGSRFRLNFRYRVRLDGLPSAVNLGAFGIRQGSERVTIDDRLLVRGVDYVIDYDIGLVTLLQPQAALGSNPDAEIRATWEQKSLFDVAPTTVFGLHARSPLGPFGELSLVGLYQGEQSLVRRPQLGMAPRAVMLGGLSGRLAVQADWLASALEAIPFLRTDSIARLDLTGELALSAPDPNRRGHTYLDDFEAGDEVAISLETHEWRLGSAPQDPAGAPALPWPLTAQNAASLVWQDRYLDGGRQVGFLQAQEIDQQIGFAGARVTERVLYLTMAGEPPPDAAPHWRSITTVLSTTGRDLSRSEYLEFYVSAQDAASGAVLVFDIGTVSEDAFYFDSTHATSGVDALGRSWGLGVLDEEASLARREVWGPEDDRLGLWGQRCEADRLNPVSLGDPRANCTVNNGRRDTEDLNGNGVLDAFDGPAFRYVVPIAAGSPFLVRGEEGTGTQFRLFRVPLRGPGGIAMHGASDATWRHVQHMRVTVVKPRAGRGSLALARFRIAGSRWTKREVHGIMRGELGDQPGAGAGITSVRVGPVSRLTDGPAYESPPGVEDELQDPKSAIGASGAEFNEKGLGLSWDGLLGDERAEVYFRYPQQPRSYLEYREIRFWAVARSGSWGPNGDHRLQLRVGTDPRNYYLYQVPLQPAPSGGAVTRQHWLPEHVVDFEVWFALKAEAERLLTEAPGQPITVWSEDGRYAVVLEDRARAPNLSAVRELTFAVHNRGPAETTGEVWLNDVRLGAGARDVGLAGRFDATLDAGGFVTATASFTGRGARFRQLDDIASYQSRDELAVHTTAELGRFAPAAWGVSMPVTVSYARTALDPFFLQGTDVRADRLPGLRDTGASRRRIGVTVRKTTRSSNPLVAALVDGTALRLSHIALSDRTVTSSSRLDGIEGGIELERPLASADVGIVPGFVRRALRRIAPRRLEESEFFQRLTGARLRLTPERVGFSTGYLSQDASVWRYDRVLETPRDLDVVPIQSPRRNLDGGARIAFRPFETLTGRIAVTTARDVLDPELATNVALEQDALRRARRDLAGLPVGWERDRTVLTDAAFRPVVADWLRPSVSWSSRFGQRRDPAYLAMVEDGPDGAEARLQRTFHTDSRITRGVILDPALALGDVLAPLRPIKPVELTWTDGVGSRFDRELAEPGLAYQLGVGRLDDIRFLGADTAATAVRRDVFRTRSGIRLAPTASIDFGYSEAETRVYDRHVGRRDQTEHSWPDVQLAWHEIPVPRLLGTVLDRWSVSTGYVRAERVVTLVGDIDRTRSTTEGTIPFELRLGLPGGLAFAYVAAITAGDGLDPTGTTEHGAIAHGLDLSGRFPAPFGLNERVFPEPLRLAFAYDYHAEQHCRTAGGAAPGVTCTPFIDHISRRVNLSLSSLLTQLDLGLQLSYIDRRSFIGTQIGSSQFQLGLFGQFNMQAGSFAAR